MIALFEVTIGLIFWACYTAYKKYSDKKYKERVNNVASVENDMFATIDEINEFRSKGDSAIDEVSNEMISMFGENWKDRFVWHKSNSVLYSCSETNMTIGWEAVGILYFAKRGKLISRYYKVIPNRKEDNIIFFKNIERLIQNTKPGMRMVFIHDMYPDLYERGKYHVNKSGSGKLTWNYYNDNFESKYEVTEYLW